MSINKQAFAIAGVTAKDFETWCKENKKPSYKTSSKQEFFARIQDGRLVKDKNTGKLIKKYRKK